MVQILLGEKNVLFCFYVAISWLLFTFEWIHYYAKWSIHALINHVLLSIRLNNLIARYKTNWNKKMQLLILKKGKSKVSWRIYSLSPYYTFGASSPRHLDPCSSLLSGLSKVVNKENFNFVVEAFLDCLLLVVMLVLSCNSKVGAW